MRRLLLTSAGLIIALYLLPMIWFVDHAPPEQYATWGGISVVGSAPTPSHDPDLSASSTSSTPSDGSDSPDLSHPSDFSSLTDAIPITVSLAGTPTEMPLETYVECVTAAEIPDDFPPEAIRAQAVAARTYAVYKLCRGRPELHPDAELCDDFRHCAAFRDISAETDRYTHIREAVRDTTGEILTYENTPIAAVFHCASGQRTESALDVWGEDVPYLQSVVSPGGSAAAQYEGTFPFTASEFRRLVSTTFPQANVSGSPADWFKHSTRSAAGGVKTVELGGVTVDGNAIRDLFALNSTNFTITTTEDTLTFHTIGYGHGVGLSQYGARYLAEQGQTYAQILAHYYTGTVLDTLPS